MSLLTEHDVVNMRFNEPKDIKEGYDQDEVDVFLDEVAETIAKLTKDNADLENKLKAAEDRVAELESAAPAAAPASGGTSDDQHSEAVGLLARAQEVYDKHVMDGQAESNRLISEAEAKAKSVVSEAETTYTNTLAKLEEEKGLLERKISELRDFERDYRTRLKSYLSSLLSSVESEQTED
ncbi:MAG: DivIVA domain-containing protein [Actinomycetaceae bacterium]|nr:DivIVA domain-containing protein [Kiritimatiellia bacterium]MBR6459483.1 DivIVA domain-containing protein [Actinomycetaceae bacterium]